MINDALAHLLIVHNIGKYVTNGRRVVPGLDRDSSVTGVQRRVRVSKSRSTLFVGPSGQIAAEPPVFGDFMPAATVVARRCQQAGAATAAIPVTAWPEQADTPQRPPHLGARQPRGFPPRVVDKRKRLDISAILG